MNNGTYGGAVKCVFLLQSKATAAGGAARVIPIYQISTTLHSRRVDNAMPGVGIAITKFNSQHSTK